MRERSMELSVVRLRALQHANYSGRGRRWHQPDQRRVGGGF